MSLISSSLLKKLYFKGTERKFCPRYVKEVYIDKSVDGFKSDSMNYGSYSETLCIGSGAGGRITDDLPRKQLTLKQENANKLAVSQGRPLIYYGEKTINQIRIEAQATEFKRLCSKYNITVASPYNTQVRIYKQFDDNVMLSGELDIFPTLIMGKDRPRLAIIDLKLTADLTTTFGEFAWGDFESMDNIQGLMYHYLVRDIDYELNATMNGNNNLSELLTPATEKMIANNDILFLFWTWDYKRPIEKLSNKFFPVEWNKTNESEFKETVRKCASLIDYYDETGWKELPGKQCDSCVLTCKFKNQ